MDASCWLFKKKSITMHGNMNVKFSSILQLHKKIPNKFFENTSKCRCWETTRGNQNCIYKEIKSGWNSDIAF